MIPISLSFDCPSWISDLIQAEKTYATPEEQMALAILLSRENVRHKTGGPFGAAVFATDSGKLISAGVNSVTRLNNSVLHAETMALMLAQKQLDSYSLNAPDLPALELMSSCEACAMCLGAILWSGIKKVGFAASRDDAMDLGFEEGPVFPETYTYLEKHGIQFERDLLREEAREVLRFYKNQGGVIYNP